MFIRLLGKMSAPLTVALMFAGAAPVFAQEGPPPAQVEISTAAKQFLAPQVTVPGTVVSRNDSRVAAQVAGQIVWIAEVGAVMGKGDLIARLDNRSLLLAKRNQEARVRRLVSSLKYEESQVGRYRELARTNNTPQRQFDEAIMRRDTTIEDLEQARVALEQVELNLSRTEIRALFPGRIVERVAELGEYANAGSAIARVVDTMNIEVSAMVPVGLAPHLSDGLMVSLKSGDTVVDTRIRSIVPVGDDLSRTMEVRVEVPRNLWIVGSAVRVSLPSSSPREVVAVPRDALILRADNTYIYRVNGDNKAERIVVKPGAASGDYVEVSGNVADGDRIVTRGGERLREGQDVQITERS